MPFDHEVHLCVFGGLEFTVLSLTKNSSCTLSNTTFIIMENLFYILREKSNKMQQCIKILLFLILNEAQHVGRCQVAYPT